MLCFTAENYFTVLSLVLLAVVQTITTKHKVHLHKVIVFICPIILKQLQNIFHWSLPASHTSFCRTGHPHCAATKELWGSQHTACCPAWWPVLRCPLCPAQRQHCILCCFLTGKYSYKELLQLITAVIRTHRYGRHSTNSNSEELHKAMLILNKHIAIRAEFKMTFGICYLLIKPNPLLIHKKYYLSPEAEIISL